MMGWSPGGRKYWTPASLAAVLHLNEICIWDCEPEWGTLQWTDTRSWNLLHCAVCWITLKYSVDMMDTSQRDGYLWLGVFKQTFSHLSVKLQIVHSSKSYKSLNWCLSLTTLCYIFDRPTLRCLALLSRHLIIMAAIIIVFYWLSYSSIQLFSCKTV